MKSFDNEDVVFCDNHMLVAVKETGLLTQPDASHEDSLEARLKHWIGKTWRKEGNVFLHAVHRLDRPVSGLVLFARTSKALSRLNEQSRNGAIERVYYAEVEGIVTPKLGRLDHYLLRQEFRSVVVDSSREGAKHARLRYEVAHFLPHSTLVRIELETGRYHQIRAQWSAAGYPVVGDRKYGAATGDGREIRLHAAQLALMHPVTKEILSFESAPPFL